MGNSRTTPPGGQKGPPPRTVRIEQIPHSIDELKRLRRDVVPWLDQPRATYNLPAVELFELIQELIALKEESEDQNGGEAGGRAAGAED